MKKCIVSLCIIFGLMLPTTNAHAGYGLATGNWALADLGGKIFGSGYSVAMLLAFGSYESCDGGHSDKPGCKFVFGMVWGSVRSGMLGLVILEDEHTYPEFTTINQATANKLQISEHEMTTYNNEVDEYNLIMSEAVAEFRSLHTQDAKVAANVFNGYKDYLSPETLNVVDKLIGGNER